MPLHKSFWCQHTEVVCLLEPVHMVLSWILIAEHLSASQFLAVFEHVRFTTHVPTFLFHPCFIDSACKKKNDGLLIHGTGIHYLHPFSPSVDMRNFSVHIIGYVPQARPEQRTGLCQGITSLRHVVVGLLSRLLLVCSLLARSTPGYQLVSETIRSFLET